MANNNAYPDSGWINENTKRTSDSHPHWRGTINVSPELAAKIAQDGKFDIVCWDKPDGQYGKSMSAKVSVAWKKPDQQGQAPKQGNYDQRPKQESYDQSEDAGF